MAGMSLGVPQLLRPSSPAPEAGSLLVAAPSLLDPNFVRTVIYLLQHDESGSAGVILNQTCAQVLNEPEFPGWLVESALTSRGGPVMADSIMALAEPSSTPAVAQRSLGPGLCVLDLEHIEHVSPVHPVRVFVGHSGWGSGQLVAELATGDWHVVPGHPDDVLLLNPAKAWATIVRRQPMPIRLWATLAVNPREN